MPNWCNNILEVSGKEKIVRNFEKFAQVGKGSPFSLESLVPIPKTLNENEGYTWRMENWGCKWDVNPVTLCRDYTSPLDIIYQISYVFDSPWSPPIPAVVTVSEKFPELNFKLEYTELGTNLLGDAIIKNGVLKICDVEIKRGYCEECQEMTKVVRGKCIYCQEEIDVVIKSLNDVLINSDIDR